MVLFGTLLYRLGRSCKRVNMSTSAEPQPTSMEGNPRLVDAIAGCDHPVLRVHNGTIISPQDIGRLEPPWYNWLSPVECIFWALGIHSRRPTIRYATYAASEPLRVRLDDSNGQLSTYSAEKSPWYREAFLHDTSRGMSVSDFNRPKTAASAAATAEGDGHRGRVHPLGTSAAGGADILTLGS